MEMRQLRYFCEIAECGSFSRAARTLAIAQPALSRQIRLLEESLASPLFYRNGRGIMLTTAGEVFLTHARQVLAQVDQACRDVGALKGMPQGTVTLGLPPSVSMTLLRPLVARLTEAHPKIRLRVKEGFSGNVWEWLQAGKVDLAVIYDDRRSSGIRSEPLIREELLLVHSPSLGLTDPVSAEVLADLPLVLPGRPHGLRLLVDSRMAEVGKEVTVKFEVDSMAMMKELAADGVASTILPFGAVQREVQAGFLKATPIASPELTRMMALATAANRPFDLAHRATLALIREIAARSGGAPGPSGENAPDTAG